MSEGTTLDKLSIELVANSENAEKALTKLASSLTSLENNRISGVANSMSKLTLALDKLSRIELKNLDRASDALSKLSRARMPSMKSFTDSVERLSGSATSGGLESLANALTGLASLQQMPAIGVFANNIERLANADSTNIERTFTAVREGAESLRELVENDDLRHFVRDLADVTRGARQAAQALHEAAQAAHEVNEEAGGGEDNNAGTVATGGDHTVSMSGWARFRDNIADTIDNIGASVEQNINNLGEAIGNTSGISNALGSLSSAFEGNALSVAGWTAVITGAVAIAKGAAEYFWNFGKSVLSIEWSIASTGAGLLGSALTHVADSLVEVGAHIGEVGLEKLKEYAEEALNPIQLLTAHLDELRKVLSKISFGLVKADSSQKGWLATMANSFVRMAKMRAMSMFIRSAINQMGEAMKNLYYNNATFANSMDTCSTAAQYLRNSIAAALSPAINALAPVIDFIVDKIVDFINVINMLIATITGASTWNRAIKYPKAYADAVSSGAGSAADSAKDLKEALTLLSFDEINKLNENSSSGGSGGGGGGGGSGTDYSSMFEEVATSLEGHDFAQIIADTVASIKAAIGNGDWYGAGMALAEGIGKAVDYAQELIDSEELHSKIEMLCWRIIDSVNGFFDTMSSGGADSIATSIGTLFGSALSLAMESLDSILVGIHWENIGASIAQFVNGGMERIEESSSSIVTALANAINAAFEMLEGYDGTIEWETVGSFLAGHANQFISTLNMEQIGQTIGSTLGDILTSVDTFLTDTDFYTIGERIGTGIREAIYAFLYNDMDGPNFGTVLANAIIAGCHLVNGFIGSDVFENIGSVITGGITSFLSSEAPYTLALTLANVFRTAITTLTGLLNGLPWYTIGQRVGSFISTTIESSIGNGQLGEVLAAAINAGIKALNGLSARLQFSSIGRIFGENVNKFFSNVSATSFGAAIASFVNSALTQLNHFANTVHWGEIGQWIADGINSFLENFDGKKAGSAANNLINGLTEMLSTAIDGIDKDELATAIHDVLEGLDVAQIASAILDLWKKAVSTIAEAMFQAIFEVGGYGNGNLQAEEGVGSDKSTNSIWDYFLSTGGQSSSLGLNTTSVAAPFLQWVQQLFGENGLEVPLTLSDTASALWELFFSEWLGIDPHVEVTDSLKNGGRKQAEETQKTWNQRKPKVELVTNVSKSGGNLATDTVIDWNNKSPRVYLDDTNRHTGGTLAGNVTKEWNLSGPVAYLKDEVTTGGKKHLQNIQKEFASNNVNVYDVLRNNPYTLWSQIQTYFTNNGVKVSVTPQVTSKIKMSAIIDRNSTVTVKAADSSGKIVSGGLKLYAAAKGGIVDAATLFGDVIAGEAGTEAIMPLERNTGWMDRIADRISESINSGNGNGDTPVVVQVNLDGKVVGRSAVTYINNTARKTGNNPLSKYI